MPIHDLYSKRQQRLRGEVLDVYEYNNMTQKMRMQIAYILNDMAESFDMDKIFRAVDSILSREYGLEFLANPVHFRYNYTEAIKFFLLNTPYIDHIFDVIEITFMVIYNRVNNIKSHYQDEASFLKANMKIITGIENTIKELNERFKENGLGYQFENNSIIRIDSEYIHKEAVKPALVLLYDAIYTNANDEFLKAHEHYRHNHYEAAISEANKALESVLKIICTKHGWDFPATATAQPLLMIVKEKGLIPPYLLSHFESLINTLKSGLPTMRNKNAGHGAGAEEREIPAYLASYALHLAATNIVFLIEAEKAMV